MTTIAANVKWYKTPAGKVGIVAGVPLYPAYSTGNR